MSIFTWFADRNSNRNRAMSFYKRGVVRQKRNDRDGAVQAYTDAIDLQNTPGDILAMALYGRALAHLASGRQQMGVDDLDAVLAMDDPPTNVRTTARVERARVDARIRDGE